MFSLCFTVFSKRLLMKMDALLFGSGENMCLERERKLVQRLNGDEATESKQGSGQTRPLAQPSGTEGRPEEGEQGAVGAEEVGKLRLRAPDFQTYPHSHREDELLEETAGAFVDHLVCTGA